MNQRKVAIFVEGPTELYFVRDALLQWYSFDSTKVGIECHALRSNTEFSVPYPYGSEDSVCFYRIISVGCDLSVIKQMITNAERYANMNYDLVLGLKDMFSDAYHAVVKNRTIDIDVNKRFIVGNQEQLDKSPHASLLQINFAIMETEAWILSMPQLLSRISPTLTQEYIANTLSVDLTQDVENSIYHPALVLEKILALCNKTYRKHSDEVQNITSQITKDDCKILYESGKNESFRVFWSMLLKDDINI